MGWQYLVVIVLILSFLLGVVLYYLSKVCRGIAFFLVRKSGSAKEEFRNWGRIGNAPIDL